MNLHLVSLLAGSILWGTTGTAQALAPAGAPPMAIGALRLCIGGVALLILTLLRRVPLAPLKQTPIRHTLIASSGMAAYQVFFFSAVLKTGVAVGTMVTIGSAPVFAGALAYGFIGEAPGMRWAIATLMAVVGCAVLILGGTATLSTDRVGILMALISGFSYAVFVVAARQTVQGVDSQLALTVMVTVAALMICPLLGFVEMGWVRQPNGWSVVLYLGVVTMAVSYGLFVFGLKRIPAAAATTLSLAEPLTACLLGIFFLGEALTAAAGTGVVLLMAGLIVLSVGSRRTGPPGEKRPGVRKV